MSYGLWISDGVNGGVITNSNAITNTESESAQAGTIPASGSITISNLPGAGDPSTIGITFNDGLSGPNSQDSGLEITRNLAADTLTITNTTGVPKNFDIAFFRFK